MATPVHSNCPPDRHRLDPPAGILETVADRLLVNIHPDVIHRSFEEPPWLFSESNFPLSQPFVHHVLLADLAYKQLVRNRAGS
jgi:hypothetical protein